MLFYARVGSIVRAWVFAIIIFATEMCTCEQSGKVRVKKRVLFRREKSSSKRRSTSVSRTALHPSENSFALSARDATWLDLRSRRSTQASTLRGRGSALSVDGNDNVLFDFCSAISCGSSPGWWEVELGGRFDVVTVQVVRRAFPKGDPARRAHFDEQSGPFSIQVDDHLCAENQQIVLPPDALQTTSPAKLTRDINCTGTGSKVKLMKPRFPHADSLVICEVKVKATLSRNWTLLSNTRICEHHFWLRSRMNSLIRSECTSADSNSSLKACQLCCYTDLNCHTIDYFTESNICMRYRGFCVENETVPAYHGGVSYALD
eukprot:TRINITY_DN68732_c0_g1_i1.p1 TRINITY_DN68732_c0_g1~~TRINITY_DN68732_c0_g1_i1.p1  ORF type:complete len:319 (+),score=15.62 TRINITY_DN68732_c0_g1_i1:117-1073(+)